MMIKFGVLDVIPSSKLGVYLDNLPREEQKGIFKKMMRFKEKIKTFVREEADKALIPGPLGQGLMMMGLAEQASTATIRETFKDASPELQEALTEWLRIFLRIEAGILIGSPNARTPTTTKD